MMEGAWDPQAPADARLLRIAEPPDEPMVSTDLILPSKEAAERLRAATDAEESLGLLIEAFRGVARQGIGTLVAAVFVAVARG